MLQRFLGTVLTVLGVAVAIVFASLAAAVLLAAGLLVWTWAWWRSRHGRPFDARVAPDGVVIEGEFRDETRTERLSQLKQR